MPTLLSGLRTVFDRPAPETLAQPDETKHSATRQVIALQTPAGPVWTPRDYAALARNGFMRNVIAYRCIRLVAEAAASIPFAVTCKGEAMAEHDHLRLLKAPNPDQSGTALMEDVYGYLQTAGNAYVEAVRLDGTLRELYALRPDRMKVRAGRDGWPGGYDYEAGGRRTGFRRDGDGFMPVLHLKLFHPLNDHYGLAPLEAAGNAVDIHNAACSWNKALLDNAARPSGALIYNGPADAANLTADQFERLKSELQETYQGQTNAGRPMVLDGGLDWKPMSHSPAELDFIEAKHSAARDVALAFGVPPQLLGIPGDNTYANYREANLAFWRQTVLPLAGRAASALSGERSARLDRIMQTDCLTDREKRLALGFPANPETESDDE
ncbi:phage portal protein [Aquisalinus flavus]|uniref:Portal protein n=1 Tax=Aquisalinus flavus TaxID=1526572 RepID=A0A8J2V591_9PROT|nr:phage portal protein [Aquisalinus flavus]MBD0426281.1 phage portal protein [Aquisalinus flavus]UNE48149.1 phage portal protein [Aquisalinus flavus]GGD09197.1 portal protein [Aquisalinus flavus]